MAAVPAKGMKQLESGHGPLSMHEAGLSTYR
jgi:hypothetical protein